MIKIEHVIKVKKKENKGSDDTAIRTHMVEGFRRQKINLLGCNKSIKGLEKLWSILEEASVVIMMCMIATEDI